MDKVNKDGSITQFIEGSIKMALSMEKGKLYGRIVLIMMVNGLKVLLMVMENLAIMMENIKDNGSRGK